MCDMHEYVAWRFVRSDELQKSSQEDLREEQKRRKMSIRNDTTT